MFGETKSKSKNVKFRRDEGKITIDSEFRNQDDVEEDFDYLWRCQDYSYKPVKKISDYMKTEEGVKTDVIIFNRQHSSEFDVEREELKDELLAWNERYKKRMEDKISVMIKT